MEQLTSERLHDNLWAPEAEPGGRGAGRRYPRGRGPQELLSGLSRPPAGRRGGGQGQPAGADRHEDRWATQRQDDRGVRLLLSSPSGQTNGHGTL